MLKTKAIDIPLAITILFVLLFGLLMLASASFSLSYKNFGHNYYYLKHQIFFGVISGLIFLFIGFKTPYEFWKKIAPAAFIFSLILMLLVFLPHIGQEIRGAKRWLEIGGISFQPSELLKLTMVIYMAALFANKNWQANSFLRGFVPFATITGIISLLLIFQPDVGTLIILASTATVVYFLAGGKILHLLLLLGIGSLAFWGLVHNEPYRLNRILAFLNPNIDPQGISYQISRSIIFIGSGKLLGSGIGSDPLQYERLPEAMGDSIFAVIGHELGFFGAMAVVLAFLFIGLRGLNIAKNTTETFGRLVAAGITTFICLQAFVNIGAISGFLPLTGVPLPFMSYGGSALMVALFSVGILLNISSSQKSLKNAEV
ncbi:putative lipid II flippase FtsW [Candidatus Parcubacteria bacterium]|nr:MAG: putative lipid II flippase FtsW [Candidatus Parcubacteria bacterium]